MAEENGRCSLLFRKIMQVFYFVHLIIALIFSVYIIAKYPKIVSPTITFIMIVIYGFMLIWALLLTFILILCKQHQKAVCITRILLKLIIFAFPIFGILSINKDHELFHWQIKAFILYMIIIAGLLLLYQIVSCLCCGRKYPDYLFEYNDLEEANKQVLTKRKEYDQTIGKT